MFGKNKFFANMFAATTGLPYPEGVSGAQDQPPSERFRDQLSAQLRKEMRAEAIRLRNEMRDEFQRQLSEQMAEQMSTMHRGGPRGPRGHQRGRPRGNLSRDAIVDVAMEIMTRRGLDKVTMRSIAHELNTGPASIYAHVSSMAELHGHMLDRIVGGIDLTRTQGTWRERVTELLSDLSHELLRYPDLARSALEVRPFGEHALAFADHLIGLLAEGGVSPARRALGMDLLTLWTMGGAAEHAADAQDPATPRENLQAFRDALGDGSAYPHLYAVQDAVFTGTGDARFAWGVDALLTGIVGSAEPDVKNS